MNIETLDFIGLFLYLAGLIIGLGGVTVIDILGFIARKNTYWTEVTIKAHKVTKVINWSGTILAIIGASIFYRDYGFSGIPRIQAIIAAVLILNAFFLSFYVSRKLIKLEQDGKEKELLAQNFQNKIVISFLISFTCWWSQVVLAVLFLLQN